jgi:hypothetical protein
VIIRYPDRTFEEHTTITDDPGKAPTTINSSGTWSITGWIYTVTFQRIDNPDYGNWAGTLLYEVLARFSANHFTYKGETTPVLTETRIAP